ncbi:MAG: tRNA (5-methylaminomethyl-2-thiouridine)(34)-methyltransferase MnmD [Pseudomonadota bacterium]
MSDQTKQPHLEWRGGHVPVATRFDDPYFSLADGAAETRHVFIDGNDLPNRIRDGFRVGELGFGTGLNLCVLLDLWFCTKRPGKIHFTSFEAFPLPQYESARALRAFPHLAAAASVVASGFQNDPFQLSRSDCEANVILGDARDTVAAWDHKVDAWFLDGFSPQKNPELWEAALLQSVFDKTSKGGTFATYSAAGYIRQRLSDVGFEVARVKGFGRKRHMTIGRKP